MNVYKLCSFVIFLLSSCASKKEAVKEVSFTIDQKITSNNSSIILTINNPTKESYYFPILNSIANEKLDFLLTKDENDFFCAQKLIFNMQLQEIYWKSDNCFAESVLDEALQNLQKEWSRKRQKLTKHDFVLVKAGEQKVVEIPLSRIVPITTDCTWKLNAESKEKVSVRVVYKERSATLAVNFLSNQTLTDLKQSGYSLYEKQIVSNQILVSFESGNLRKD